MSSVVLRDPSLTKKRSFSLFSVAICLSPIFVVFLSAFFLLNLRDFDPKPVQFLSYSMPKLSMVFSGHLENTPAVLVGERGLYFGALKHLPYPGENTVRLVESKENDAQIADALRSQFESVKEEDKSILSIVVGADLSLPQLSELTARLVSLHQAHLGVRPNVQFLYLARNWRP